MIQHVGSGSLLIRALNEAPVKLSGYGQEKDTTTAGLAKMNVVLHNNATAQIKVGNTFSDPQYFEEGSNETELRKFDYIVANPPFSMKNWKDGFKEYGRFEDYENTPPEKNADYVWLLHILSSLKDKGKAAVILPHGVLFRGNAEGEIRKAIIEKGYIKGIIGLPANLFYGTGIPACIIVIDKEEAYKRNGIFMIDASNDYIKDDNKNRLRERDIYKIVKTFNEQITDNPKYARFVPMDEIIEKNEYNLNISRYIDSNNRNDLQDIEAHLEGGIPQNDIDGLNKYWKVFKELKKKLFDNLRKGYYKLNVSIDKAIEVIYNDKEFTNYANVINNTYEKWKREIDDKLRNINKNSTADDLIQELSKRLFEEFNNIELIDKYDIYEVLLVYWRKVMSDDVFLLIYDGYSAGREITKEYVIKEKKGKDGEKITEYTDKVKSWDGQIIPKSIIINEYFQREKKEIEDIELMILDIQDKMDKMIEEADEGMSLKEIQNDKGKITQKDLKAKIKELLEQIEEDVNVSKDTTNDYNQLVEFEKFMNENCKNNKILRNLNKALEEKVKCKYAKLTDNEIKELIVDKKWYTSIFNGIYKLYEEISSNLTFRITELAKRYEETLKFIENGSKEAEKRVKPHLEEFLNGKERIPGFNGEWIEVPLGEIGILTGSGVDKKISPDEKPITLLNFTNVFHQTKIFRKDLNHEVTASSEKIKMCSIKKGDVLLTPTSETPEDIAYSAVAAEDMPDVVYSYHVVRLRPFDGVNGEYINYALNTQHFRDQAMCYAEGSGIRYVITLKKFNEMTIKMPKDPKEQEAIVTYLNDIDDEIEILEKKLEKYKKLREGMKSELLTEKRRK